MSARRGLNRARVSRRVRGRRNEVRISGAVLRNVHIKINGDRNRVVIAPNARLSNLVLELSGDDHEVMIGSHVRIHRGAIRLFDTGSTVSIGERSTIYEASLGVTEGGKITLGYDCLLAEGVDLRNGDSHSIIDVESGKRINAAEDVVVGDHVWLGARVIVLKGSRIGDHTVIGAGSIVTGPIDANVVAVGAPAREVLSGTDWRRERL